ncbi:MAG: hypothetical protein COU98_02180 [Candidatus Staskawiczbacteria bacterium CG10_big_fil_rev_8_21_14_0_10_38_10]|uniref:Uncharacterized protein n=1 Tax=Candidatus Staskawiczbacteria bacterium CG10_big_fil_rev_8_21_14_0_10_38_10 TaxID=1974891 RepID=A0A2H9T110_9BACT|nr:MAG: hypothetical protein COU98_02180 [Candidatus Staskawiczbacteria bacterium CG10_big_fil_rev_8_21_14_0_10_38_10]
MKRFTIGNADILKGRLEIKVEKEEIMRILPHRGRMLLLDGVLITPEIVRGAFRVTPEVCDGHAFKGKMILRGADILDMAAQTLGVWAGQYPDLQERIAFVYRYGETKFIKPAVPSDTLIIEANPQDLTINIRRSAAGEIIRITGKNFSARVGDRQIATVTLVELIIVNDNGSV